MSEIWERGQHPGQAEVHEPIHRTKLQADRLERERFDREVAAMAGELRDIAIDVGSFLLLSTEATNEQRLALAKLTHRYRPSVKRVWASIGGAGLPRDYVLFNLFDAADNPILTGGIDREGSVST